MADRWTDDHLDVVLRDVADELDVPGAAGIDPLAVVRRSAARRRRWLVAAAVLVLVVAAVLAVAPTREAVARWFGLQVEHDDGSGATVTDVFASAVVPLDIDEAIVRSGLDPSRLAASGLGRPDEAGQPPEGGVLLSWPRGATTLWVRPGDDDMVVVKRLTGNQLAEPVDGLGDYAVLIDGRHVLETPSRRVATGRVLWWLADGRQFRLESELDADAMLAIAHALAP